MTVRRTVGVAVAAVFVAVVIFWIVVSQLSGPFAGDDAKPQRSPIVTVP